MRVSKRLVSRERCQLKRRKYNHPQAVFVFEHQIPEGGLCREALKIAEAVHETEALERCSCLQAKLFKMHDR